jgi:hypothetical protein
MLPVTLHYRAKTNKASLPDPCERPEVVTIGVEYVLLRMKVPAEGGATIRVFVVEAMDLDDNVTREVRQLRNAADKEPHLQCRVSSLHPGASYIFRCRAVSDVGAGQFSEWTGETKMHTPDMMSAKEAAGVGAGALSTKSVAK